MRRMPELLTAGCRTSEGVEVFVSDPPVVGVMTDDQFCQNGGVSWVAVRRTCCPWHQRRPPYQPCVVAEAMS